MKNLNKMKKLSKVTIITFLMVISSVSVSAQINELKRTIAESNKELPEKMNAVMTLENVKYEGGYVQYSVSVNLSPRDFVNIFKNKKREELVSIEPFVTDKDAEDMVSLMIKTNTGLKYIYKCSSSNDVAEASYSADEIIICKQKGATEPYLILFGMDYLKWFVNLQNEINKNIDSTGFICNGEMYIIDNTLVYTVLVTKKGIYKELDFDAVQTNRMTILTSTPHGKKMLSEMVKLNMSLDILIKDMHSNKSHRIKLNTNKLNEYVN